MAEGHLPEPQLLGSFSTLCLLRCFAGSWSHSTQLSALAPTAQGAQHLPELVPGPGRGGREQSVPTAREHE